MSDSDDIYLIISCILRNNLKNPDLVVTAQTRPDTLVGWDSVKMIDIVLDSEDAFDIRLNADDIDCLHSIGVLIDMITAKLAVKSLGNL